MSIRFALVSEGPTDFLILRAVIVTLLPDAEVVPWHPEVPVSAYPEYAAALGNGELGTGWRGVQRWCEEYGSELELMLGAVVGDTFDALVVHVDASIADKMGVEQPCPPASSTTNAMRVLILEQWLQRPEAPPFLVLATPSKMTDAWAVAAVAPELPNIECDVAIERELIRRKYVTSRGGKAKKDRRRFETLAARVAASLQVVRASCTEAERFAKDVEALAE